MNYSEWFNPGKVFKDVNDQYPQFLWPAEPRPDISVPRSLTKPKPPEPPGCLGALLPGAGSEYKKRKDEYDKKYELYLKNEEKREEAFKILSNPSIIRTDSLLLDTIASAKSFKHDYKNPARGLTESHFERELLKHFPGKIYVDKVCDIPDGFEPYVPDFIYYNSDTNLHIDIEVDEVYTLKDGNPVHYLRYDGGISLESVDVHRDNTFKELGWFIIKFTENQVLNHSGACIELIKNLEKSLEELRKTGKFFPYSTRLKSEPRWTIEQAINEAQLGTREKFHGLTRGWSNPTLAEKQQQDLERWNSRNDYQLPF